jgi:hypothetical protein
MQCWKKLFLLIISLGREITRFLSMYLSVQTDFTEFFINVLIAAQRTIWKEKASILPVMPVRNSG